MAEISSSLALGLLGGGSALSGLGGILGGQSQNRAARQSRDWYNRQTGANSFQLGNLLYGPGYGDFVQSSFDQIDRGQRGEGVGGGTDKATKDFIDSLGGPVLGQLRGISDYGQKQGKKNLNEYDRETGRLDQRSAAFRRDADSAGQRMERTADDYGKQREAVIRSDSARQLADLNDETAALLARAGLGNSSAGAQISAGNSSQVGQDMNRALAELADSRTQLMLGAQGQRMQTNTSLGQQELGRSYTRSSERMGYNTQNLDRNLALKQLPIDAMLGIQQSSVLNPWLGQNTSQYYPGASGTASALSNVGGGLAAFGAQAYGQTQMQELIRQLQQGL